MWQFKNVTRWTHKAAMRSLFLVGATTVLMPLALMPAASAQVTVGVGIGVNPPVCSYGYYDYSPYGCAPSGFYGPGYFYNGVFLGVGPWAHWGYGHGWGEHRFSGGRGGRYVGGGRYNGARENRGGRAYAANRGHGPAPGRSSHNNGPHAAAAHNGAAHSAPHAAAAHGGGEHGGGEHRQP
jgi:hypothetical protein